MIIGQSSIINITKRMIQNSTMSPLTLSLSQSEAISPKDSCASSFDQEHQNSFYFPEKVTTSHSSKDWQTTEASIMQWLASKGILRGQSETLLDEYTYKQRRTIISHEPQGKNCHLRVGLDRRRGKDITITL